MALVILGPVALLTLRAQPNSGALPVTTKWVGYLVVGQTDKLDRITPEPSPTTVREVEIGLRSDGVVIWRETGKTR